MINFNILDQSSYEALRFNLISQVEEGGNLRLEPYLDLVGIPTVGIGMNLRNNKVFEEVMKTFGVEVEEAYYGAIKNIISSTHTSKTQLQDALNEVMQQRFNDASIDGNKRTTFSFADNQEIIDTYDELARFYEDEVNSRVSNIPLSSERAALFSLAYNKPALIGPNLQAAVNNGDRPQAWYEIRYQTNGGESRGTGIAKRRYYESQIFGIYDDPNSVDEAEARAVFEMYASNRTQITNYDHNYHDEVANANRDYSTTIVQDFSEATKVAHDLLVANHAPGIAIDQILAGSDGRDSLSEGTSTGSSTLMLGGSEKDIYSFASISGQDVIEDPDLDGKIRIAGVTLEGNFNAKTDADGNVIPNRWGGKGYDFARIGLDLVITNAGANPEVEGITVKDFPFSNLEGAFGITLGKSKEILRYDDQYIPQNHDPDYGRPGTVSRDALVIQTPDRRGRFIAPAYPKNKQLQWGTITAFGIGVFDDEGNVISYSPAADFYDQNEVTVVNGQVVGDNGNVRYSAFARMDMAPLADGSHIGIFGSYDHRHFSSGGRMNYVDGESSIHTFRVSADGVVSEPSLVTSVSDPIASVSLSPAAFSAASGGYNINYLQSGSPKSVFIPGEELSNQTYPVTFDLPSGVRVSSGRNLNILTPIFRDATGADVPLNYALSDYEISATNPEYAQQFATYDWGATSILQVTPAADAAICVSGAGDLSRIDLSGFDGLDINYLEANAYEVSAAERSLDDLMSAEGWERRLQEADDDYKYLPDEGSEEVLDDAQKFTILPLPNNQRVVFTNVGLQDLVQNPEEVFLGVNGLNSSYAFGPPSTSPSWSPTVAVTNPNPIDSSRNNGGYVGMAKEYGPYAGAVAGLAITGFAVKKFVDFCRKGNQVGPDNNSNQSGNGRDVERG